MLVGRSRILNRIALAESRLISIVAPAGFGKTTIAKAVAEEHGSYALCDVAGVTNLQAFAQQLIRAVNHVAPERADELANDLFCHLQPGVTNAQLAGFVLDVWSSVDDRNACIFDNLEALTEQPDSLDLLVRLIKMAERQLLILCSRPPFALLNSRLIPPNEHLRLGVDDLAFTREETRQVLGASIHEAQVDSVAAITRGWPVAVLLFRQLARLGHLERALTEAGSSPPEELRDYLLKEVLDSIRGPLSDTLVALVATASLGIDAAHRATQGATTSRSVLDLSARLPLVTFADGKCTIHPLISSIVLRTAGPEIERYRRIAAESYEGSGRLNDAARLYLDAGMVDDGARCLEATVGSYIERNAWSGLDELIELVPPDILANYPRLWAIISWVRRGVTRIDVLIAEATSLREKLRSNLELLEAKQINALLISFFSMRSEHEAVRLILAEYTLDEDDVSPGNVALLISDTFHKVLSGRMHGVLDRYRRLTPFVHNELVRAYLILRVDVLVKTMCGRFDDALLAQRQAHELATGGGRSAVIAGLAQQAFIVTWLSGDDAAVEALVDEMRRTGAVLGSLNYAEIASAWDKGTPDGLAEPFPRVRAILHLMLAGKATDPERRRMLLEQAHDDSRRAGDAWSEFLIVTAAALNEPSERAERLERAAQLALEIGQPELAESVASLQAGSDGAPTLRALVRRFTSVAEPVTVEPVVRVNVFSRTVWRGDQQLPITKRVLELVIILAVLGRVPGEKLLDWLWAARNLDVESNALKMLVSRARRQLREASLIVAVNGAYRLRSDVVVDFHQVAQLLGALPAHDPLTDAQRAVLRGAHEQFRSVWLNGQSVPSIDAAVSAMRHRLVERLANDALDRGNISEALSLADELRRYDKDDETAYELLIRAHIRSGNQASALREYRTYSLHLKDELGLEPSFSIDELLQASL